MDEYKKKMAEALLVNAFINAEKMRSMLDANVDAEMVDFMVNHYWQNKGE